MYFDPIVHLNAGIRADWGRFVGVFTDQRRFLTKLFNPDLDKLRSITIFFKIDGITLDKGIVAKIGRRKVKHSKNLDTNSNPAVTGVLVVLEGYSSHVSLSPLSITKNTISTGGVNCFYEKNGGFLPHFSVFKTFQNAQQVFSGFFIVQSYA
jgi:hypothetical protein